MFKKNRMAILAFSATIIFSCKKSDPGGGTTPPATQTDIATVNSKVTSFMSTYNIPGASLAVTKNGKLVYIKGFGKANTTTGELVTPASQFRLASVSKTYTGVAIMKLIQDGKLTIDQKVFGIGGVLGTDYGTAPYNANLLAITVRHLLQHTSGAWGAASGGDVIDQNPTYTYKQLFDWIINTRPNPKVPGTIFDYTNVGYNLLGRIIEKISGKTYINYIKDDILTPISATQTNIAGKTEAEQKPGEVKYYGQGADAQYVYNIAFPRRDADGGLITTATDLLKLVTATDGFATRPDILNSSSITTYTTPSAVFPGYACGIGIWSAEKVWFDYGSLPGTRTGFMRHDNGMCVALLLNSRVDPVAGENPFVFGMQDLLLDIVKNTSYNWQDIDQF
jgi:D-alanyl-D-alanine carboxypeptidase